MSLSRIKSILTLNNNRPIYPTHMSEGMKDLLMKILEKDENKRISIKEIKVR